MEYLVRITELGFWSIALLSALVLVSLLFLYFFLSSIFEIIYAILNFKKFNNSTNNLKKDTTTIISGIVEPVYETLVCPMTGKKVVFYDVDLIEHKSKNSSQKIIEEAKSIPFMVRTSQGDIYFKNQRHGKKQNAKELLISYEFPRIDKMSQDVNSLPPPSKELILKKSTNPNTGSFFGKTYQYAIQLIEAHKPVYILGKFHYNDKHKRLIVKPCEKLNSIILSDTQEGIKTNLKKTFIVLCTLAFICFLTPFALGFLILL